MTTSDTLSLSELNEQIQAHSGWIEQLKLEISKIYLGDIHVLEGLLIGLLGNGHVLLEGLPGLGKTLLIKTLAQVFKLQFNRIQFTPDLLPSDITGTLIYNPSAGSFTTKKGPIFTHILLADEINRAPSKVQSALLESMQEHQVTLGDTTYALPKPFFVLATQNPIEQEGTYPLPEAQIDRFMLQLEVTYPSKETELKILKTQSQLRAPEPVNVLFSEKEIFETQRWIDKIYIDAKIENYIVDLVQATRTPEDYNLAAIKPLLRFGVSSRGVIALALAAKVHAFLQGRGYVVPQDVKSVAFPALRHRINLSYEAESDRVTSNQIITKILETIPVP